MIFVVDGLTSEENYFCVNTCGVKLYNANKTNVQIFNFCYIYLTVISKMYNHNFLMKILIT